jgi:hypothetical protein
MDATALLPFGFDDGATFSPDRRYRYRLWRAWGDREHRCAFVMLNPSKADETRDDMTVIKCCEFARRWRFGALDIVNLFAHVSTDPTALLTAVDPIGPENGQAIEEVVHYAHRVVLAWGSHNAKINEMVRRRTEWWHRSEWPREVGTLGRTQNGSPRHPSRLAYATPFQVGP